MILRVAIDTQLMVLDSVAERLAPTGRMWAVHEINAAVAEIKSALDRHAAPASAGEEGLSREAAAYGWDAFPWISANAVLLRQGYEKGYLAAFKRYARPVAPAIAPARERLWREYVDKLGDEGTWRKNMKRLEELEAALGRNPDGTWREGA